MKIVADDKIPFLRGVLEPFADVVYVPGKDITREVLMDADALLTRTRTRCNEELLKNTMVKFIGTATIGFDHIDTKWCEKQGITWKNAPGCNSASVNQYIASTLVHLANEFHFSLKDKVLGVVGVGNVGSRVVNAADMLGMRVYLCDPPRVRAEGACGFISHDGIIRECDIITYHVPLLTSGPDKTYHTIDQKMLDKVNPGTIIINTSRGEVADTVSLKNALQSGKIAGAVLDVWEHEPDIDLELMNLCIQATPHIAGYSTDGKAKGTSMIIKELSCFFHLEMEDWEPNDIPQPKNPEIQIDCSLLSEEEVIAKVITATYNVMEDDLRLRQHPESFEKQRGDYPLRREFKAYTLTLDNGTQNTKRICRKLGFKVL